MSFLSFATLRFLLSFERKSWDAVAENFPLLVSSMTLRRKTLSDVRVGFLRVEESKFGGETFRFLLLVAVDGRLRRTSLIVFPVAVRNFIALLYDIAPLALTFVDAEGKPPPPPAWFPRRLLRDGWADCGLALIACWWWWWRMYVRLYLTNALRVPFPNPRCVFYGWFKACHWLFTVYRAVSAS